ncbi:hypothetical protein [Inquilinus limosus]|uniref:hypothetical protein n=1 Tax=Inquilinus limosus TaxID=171674 RepID=UPI00126996B9|nr:hypothetical protein [Inquilinus limosus]
MKTIKRPLYVRLSRNSADVPFRSIAYSFHKEALDTNQEPNEAQSDEDKISKDVASHGSGGSFLSRQLNNAFEYFLSSMEFYYSSASMLFGLYPMMIDITINKHLLSDLQKNGNEVSKDNSSITFEVESNFMTSLDQTIEELENLKASRKVVPKLLVINLVTTLDILMYNLIKEILAIKYDFLFKDNASISYKELKDLGSVEAAKEYLIDREVDVITRKNHYDQIKWIKDKLTLDFPLSNDLMKSLIEVCERRNLLVHTDGSVNHQYIRNCSEHNIDLSKTKRGERIALNPKYVRDSADVIFEFGSRITQAVWRNLYKKEIDEAAGALNGAAYSLIVKERFELAQRLLNFGLSEFEKKESDLTRKMMIVNLANAKKLSGDQKSAIDILDGEDWSASSNKFKICVAAVRGDDAEAIRLVPIVGKELRVEDYQKWPVFRELRKNREFVSSVEGFFGMPMFGSESAIAPEEAGKPDKRPSGTAAKRVSRRPGMTASPSPRPRRRPTLQ